MNREQARQLIPILEAYSTGKTIQFCHGAQWRDMKGDISFDSSPENYRIKKVPTVQSIPSGTVFTINRGGNVWVKLTCDMFACLDDGQIYNTLNKPFEGWHEVQLMKVVPNAE